MTRKIIILDEAEEELIHAEDWYEEPKIGMRINELDSAWSFG